MSSSKTSGEYSIQASRACEEEFIATWEQYLDKTDATLELIRFPKQFASSLGVRSFMKTPAVDFPSLKKMTSSQADVARGNMNEFIMTPSAYVEALP